ncbi:hypothetical protein HPT25_19670 [Bacillus sp. BRMEA1]|uniref:CBO0543 family protein n=1 Tax=Neobacillus endophyticus TaxID=2738405 RepID=UPI0015634533|nr:CBO0543 family protein [Neobacillus endophyticus]NRD79583.1 hypothetical protein [Neobacillus endophyticus]
MKKNKFEITFLKTILIINLILLFPVLIRKRPIKDWLLAYLFNAVTNSLADNYLTEKRTVEYPVRLLHKRFKTHVLFDYLIYPTMTVIYNQITMKDKPLVIALKTLFFTIPMFCIEFWAVRKTDLIRWNHGWKWYHSFLGVTIKSLMTRFFIGVVRWIDIRQKGYS